MGFKITDLKKPTTSTIKLTDTYKHECGLAIDFVMENTPAFANALNTVGNTMNRVASTASLSKNNQSDLTSQDSLFFLIGEYCIGDWNFNDDSGNKIAINGENFLMILASLADQDQDIAMEVANVVIEKFSKMSQELTKKADERNKQAEDAQKKSSKSGNTKAK